MGVGGEYAVGMRPGKTLIVAHRTPTYSAATGAATSAGCAKSRSHVTDRRGEVVYVAVESREDEASKQMREPGEASQTTAQDLRIPRIVSETQRRTDP